MKTIRRLLILLAITLLGATHVQANSYVKPNMNVSLDKYVLQNREDVTITVDWELPQANEGDMFTFTLPEQFRGNNKPIDLINENSVSIATSHRNGNDIVFTFNENVNDLINLSGSFWLNTRIELYDEVISDKEELVFEVNGETIVIEVGIETNNTDSPSENNRELMKCGYYNDTDSNIINWVVEVNGSNKLQANTIIKDELGKGHKLIEDSLIVMKQYSHGYEEQLFDIINISEQGYEIEVYLDSTIVIYYDTEVVEQGIDHENKVTVTTWNNIVYNDTAIAYDYASGGTGSGMKPDTPIEEPVIPKEPIEPELPNEPVVEEPKKPFKPTEREEVVEVDKEYQEEVKTPYTAPNTATERSYAMYSLLLLVSLLFVVRSVEND